MQETEKQSLIEKIEAEKCEKYATDYNAGLHKAIEIIRNHSTSGDVEGLPSWLLGSAKALLELDANNSLVPHGIGNNAREIIQAFIDVHTKQALTNYQSDVQTTPNKKD
jgi:hypothetical protein